jgi:ABC-type phosphate transport system substrate-binding protein
MKHMLARITLAFLLGMSGIGCADPIAVIIPATDARTGITLEELRLIYQRKKLLWGSGKKIYPINLPTNHPLRRSFSMALLGQSPEEMREYWNGMYFHGVLPPHVLSSQTAVLHFVENTPGAIGYVDYCRLEKNPGVTVVLVINRAAGDGVCPR